MSLGRSGIRPALVTVAALGGLAAGSSYAAETLIPRDVLFGSPDKASPQLSPSGDRIAFLAPVDGVLNVWVAPIGELESARPITHDTGSGVFQYFWAQDGSALLYLKDHEGDENHHLYRLDPKSGEVQDLTPIDGVRAQIAGVSSRRKDTVLIGLNDRNPGLHDLVEIEIATGKRTRIEENPGYFGYLADEDYRVRLAIAPNQEGGFDVLKKGVDGAFEPWTSVPYEDTFTSGPAGIDFDGRTVYMTDSRGRNTAALLAIDLDTGEETLLAHDARADIESIGQDPKTGKVRTVTINYDRRHTTVLDPAVEADFTYLESVTDGEVQLLGTTLDDRLWVVGYMMDDGPYRYYLYDRDARNATLLFTNRSGLDDYELAKMHTPIVKSRDGLDMVCYLSLPPSSDPDGDGVPSEPLPMILQPHGGPWYRDVWGYNPYHQWAANRGYAILNVEFRGSTGFGKDFINASNGEWGAKMHDDLLDAVDWAVQRGIADRDKVAIMGGSYGGYACLWGMTRTPDVFACGIDIFGVSSLVTMLESFPAYWGPAMEIMYKRIGDPRTEEGLAFLESRSPLTYVDAIQKPLLIAHGANDVRVTLKESDQLVEAMRGRNIPVTYCVYPNEGHLTFFHPENNISFYAIAEQFLAEHLGGSAESIGDALRGASLEVREGKDAVPGLRKALSNLGS